MPANDIPFGSEVQRNCMFGNSFRGCCGGITNADRARPTCLEIDMIHTDNRHANQLEIGTLSDSFGGYGNRGSDCDRGVTETLCYLDCFCVVVSVSIFLSSNSAMELVKY